MHFHLTSVFLCGSILYNKEGESVKKLVIHNENIIYKEVFIRCCPFSALKISDGLVIAGDECRLCGACAKKAKNGECEIVDTDDAE